MTAQNDEWIEVFGAREHNLKNIDISIPKNKLVVITGISGSGKSSLAFDTIYSEGQRRYMETFGAYARQFIGDMERPDVDKITGLSPVISIEQKTTNKNPRSTVGTITEVYDFLRLLFARIGEAYSYNTGKRMVKWSEEEIVENVFTKYQGRKISLLAPLVRGRKGHYRELFEDVRKRGFLKVRVDGEIKDIVPKMQVDRYKIHDIELVVDRLQVTDELKARLSQSVQQTLKIGKDLMFIQAHANLPEGKERNAQPLLKRTDKKNSESSKSKLGERIISSGVPDPPIGGEGKERSSERASYSKLLMCEDTGISYEEPSPNAFSFNSPYGACPVCKGLGNIFHINMDAIIPDPSLSIGEGGIAPLGGERDAYVYKQAQEVAQKNKISLTKPIKDIPKKSLNILLYGNEEGTETEVSVENMQFDAQAPYEGIINMLNRWFNNGHREELRNWAEEYMQLKPCETCGGGRLKKESLWFKIAGRNIAELSNMNLDNLAAWLDGIELRISHKQNIIGKDVLKEIRERLQFLLDVGLTYLTLNRSSKTLSGGESQRIRLATQIGS